MIFISNRGNLNGPDLEKENNPDYITQAIQQGFYVVIDTWIVPTKEENTAQLMLGSITPTYNTTLDFIKNPQVICRAKTMETLQILLDNDIHTFIDSLDSQLTNKGMIWSRPGERHIVPRCILYLPEIIHNDYTVILTSITTGTCSNYISTIRDTYVKTQTQTQTPKTLDPIEETVITEEENDDDNVLVLS